MAYENYTETLRAPRAHVLLMINSSFCNGNHNKEGVKFGAPDGYDAPTALVFLLPGEERNVIKIKVFHCSSRLYLTQVHVHVGSKSNTTLSIHV